MSWRDKVAVHCTHADNLPTILALGLRPASYWIDRAVGLDDAERDALHRTLRSQSVPLPHPSGHRVWIRDQGPLLRRNLADVLADGVSVADFVRTLNRHVYLFPSLDAATTLLDSYRRTGPQIILHFPLPKLLEEARHLVYLTSHNTGAIGRTTARYKGPEQFVPLHKWEGGAPEEVTLVSPGLMADQVGDLLDHVEHLVSA